MARVGDRVFGLNAPVAEGEVLLASGVDALVHGEPTYVQRGDQLVPIEYDVWRSVPERALTLDPRVGRPLRVLPDGRVFGTLGMTAPPRPQSPDSISNEAAFGGRLEAHSGWPAYPESTGLQPWASVAIERPDGHAVVIVGGAHPDACGF